MLSKRFAMILLLAGLSSPPAWAAGDPVAGKLVFHNRCDFCHSVRPDDGNGDGPNLAGIVGKKAGTEPSFEYSAGMRTSGITWTPDNISRFIQGPDAMVPGTKMQRSFRGIPVAEIPDLIAYLQNPPAGATPAAAPAGTPAPIPAPVPGSDIPPVPTPPAPAP